MLYIASFQSIKQSLNTLDSLVIKLIREGLSFDDAIIKAKYKIRMQENLACE